MAYLIKKTNFYANTLNPPTDCYLTGDDGGILEFATEGEAQAHIDELGSGIYIMEHGEYSRPDYKIVDASDPSGGETDCVQIDFQPGQGAEGGPVIAPADVPAYVKEKLDAANVDWYSSDGAIATYRETVSVCEVDADGDEVEVVYGINFYVRETALQLHADDLGNINWDYPVYTRNC